MKKPVLSQGQIGAILANGGDAGREEDVRGRFWRTARRAARQIPFIEEVAAAYFAATDPRTPTRVRGTLLAALAYFVMPADVIPDFIVAFGFTDDLAVLTAAMTAVRGHIKPRHRDQARRALADKAD